MSYSCTTSPRPVRSWSDARRAAEPAPRKPSRAWINTGPDPSPGDRLRRLRGFQAIIGNNHSSIRRIPRQSRDRGGGDGPWGQAKTLEDDVALGVVEELLLHSVDLYGRVDAGIA